MGTSTFAQSTLLNTNRRAFIGGSDARIIMGSDETALHRLWQEKRGEIEPEDLSGNLIVQLGTVTEDLNRQWYERNTGQVVTDVQRRVRHPVVRYLAATLRVTAALTEAPDADVAFERLLPTLCTELDWDAATLWQPENGGGEKVGVARGRPAAHLRQRRAGASRGRAGLTATVIPGRAAWRGPGMQRIGAWFQIPGSRLRLAPE